MTVGITELPPEGMQLGGVALAGDTERGTKTTEGLSLLFTTAGITVQGPQPQIERLLVWSGLDSATCREKVVLPDGRNAAVMELTSGGQSIRFLFPTETVTPGQAAYLDQALPHWLARYKGAPPSPVMTNGYGNDTGSGNGQDAPAATAGATSNGAPPPPPAASAGGLPPMTPAAGAAAAGAAAAGAAAAAAAAAGPTSDPAAAGQFQVAPGPSPAATGAPAATAPPPPPPPPASVAPPAPSGAPGGAATGSPLSPPPPPQTTLGGATGFAPGTQGSPLPPPGVTQPTPTGWETPTESLADTSAWAGPPTGVAGGQAPSLGKRAKGWRRSKKDSAADLRPGAFDPSRPPFEPPVDPVPLTQSTLPPPPPEGAGLPTAVGPVVWKPPVDPVTGEALWEGQPGAPSGLDPEAKPLTGRAKRKADKAAKAAAAGAAVAAAGAMADPFAGPPPATMTPGSPQSTLPGAPTAAGAPTPLTEPFDPTIGSLPPSTPGGGFDDPVAPGSDSPAPARNSRLLVLLVVALVVVVAAIAYFVVKRNNTTSTTSTTVSGLSTDAALATSINLRQSDLPAGWAPTTSTGQARPPVAPAAAQSQASQTLAQCLGVPVATVSGLFGGAGLPGQTSSATSPVFESGAAPTVQMQSVTRVMGSASQASALATPFTNPNFVTCYTAYQTTLVSAADAGSTAQVQSVGLTAPTGVQSFGYLTTLTIPSQGSEVIGQAFMVGGRIESVLQPTTAGVSVPTPAFTSAYSAMSGRIGLAVSK